MSAKDLSNVDRLSQLIAECALSPSEDTRLKTDPRSQITTKTPAFTKASGTAKTQTKEEYDHLFKLLLVWEARSGKSSIRRRYVDNQFMDDSFPTIVIRDKIKMLNVNEKKVKVQIWDAGKITTVNYYKETHGIALVYDTASRESFNKLESYLKIIKENASEKVELTVVGNKINLQSQREVSYDEAKGFADKIGAGFLEVSPKGVLIQI